MSKLLHRCWIRCNLIGYRSKLYELHAVTRLARFLYDQGKRAEARDLLAPVYGWFTEGFDTPILQESKALIDALA